MQTTTQIGEISEDGMYVDVILPLAIPRSYTYAVPVELRERIQRGVRVEVPLKNKLYAGIVDGIHHQKPISKTRAVVTVLDDVPIVQPLQFKFWEWLADYYCAHLGEVMSVAIPGGLKLSSQSKLLLNEGADIDALNLSDEEYMVAEAISIQGELTIEVIQDILNKKTVYPVIKTLLQKGILIIREELKERYTDRMADFVLLAPAYADNVEAALEVVARSEKQTRAVLSYFSLQKKFKDVPKKLIYEMAGVDSTVIKAIEKKGIWEVFQKKISRLDLDAPAEDIVLPPLSEEQEVALTEIRQAQEAGEVVLLHGITGSGKTRLYVECIQEVLRAGGQVLYLLPEIALTSQIVRRLKTRLADDMLVYHSQINEHQRVEIWNAALLRDMLFIGARSAMFLPFYKLKLIIVDEEHDSSYKQDSPNPRYQARDAAVMLSRMCGAQVVLGSATPSLESFHNAMTGKYTLVELKNRYGKAMLPEVELIDMKAMYKKGLVRDSFSVHLIDRIKATIGRGEQVILFQNRRGFAPVLRCRICEWKATCINCDVSMTYHQRFNELKCHYCGVRSKKHTACPACGSDDLHLLGLGTERIEETLPQHIPDLRIERFDYDTTRSKKNQEKILTDFHHGEIQVLVGTQMITKGFDFENIALVGVINADSLFAYPDFRASERSFQLLMQVSGRAGRREKQGQVIIQTFTPDHAILADVIQANYQRYYSRELEERRQFLYPPFYHRLAIWLRHKDFKRARDAASYVVEGLRSHLGKRVVGPVDPPIIRVRGKYQQVIYISVEKDGPIIRSVKKHVLLARGAVKQHNLFKSVAVTIDVDPY